MKARTLVLGSLALLLVATVVAFAKPFDFFSTEAKRPAASAWRVGPQDVQIEVLTDPKATKPTLIIPRPLLVTTQRQARTTPTSPLVAGVALSAAFVVGGLWLAGRRRLRGAAVSALALLALGGGALLADIPNPYGNRPNRDRFDHLRPHPEPKPEPEPEAVALPAQITLPRDVRLEVVESGDRIRLVMPAPAKPAALDAPRPIATTPRQ